MIDLRNEVSDNWRDGEKKTFIFVYYAGHGMISKAMTQIVCNGGVNKKGKPRFDYPFEYTLRSSLATERGAYVLSLFDCCREILPEGTRGLGNDESQNIDMSM